MPRPEENHRRRHGQRLYERYQEGRPRPVFRRCLRPQPPSLLRRRPRRTGRVCTAHHIPSHQSVAGVPCTPYQSARRWPGRSCAAVGPRTSSSKREHRSARTAATTASSRNSGSAVLSKVSMRNSTDPPQIPFSSSGVSPTLKRNSWTAGRSSIRPASSIIFASSRPPPTVPAMLLASAKDQHLITHLAGRGAGRRNDCHQSDVASLSSTEAALRNRSMLSIVFSVLLCSTNDTIVPTEVGFLYGIMYERQ